MDKEEDEDTTRGHEFYLRHILMLLKAAPLAIKGFLYKKVRDQNCNLADLIQKKKDVFKNSFREEFELLFEDDRVNVNIDSWDVRLHCVVVLVLFHSESDSQEAGFKAIECILDQRKDLDNYKQSAFLDYKTFETKRNSINDAVIELIKDIDKSSKFACHQMIYSFEFGSFSISSELIINLKKTNDVNIQAGIALQNKHEFENHGSYEKEELGKRQHENIEFNVKLQSKCVYVDDSVILTCELNSSEETVKWRHDNKQIEKSETLKIIQDENCHWLAMSCVRLEDAGRYSCVCCKASTTAYLRVSDKPPLIVTEELHVATEEANVRENMDIVLVCKVNQLTANVTWQHDGHVIDCNKHHVALNDNVHTLTILKAQYGDEGEYTVVFGNIKSSTKVTFTGNSNLVHRAQLTNDLYKNWIRGALGLKYLKLGLEDVSRSIVEKHHSELLKQLSSIGNKCTQCTTEELLPAHNKTDCPKKQKCICKDPRKRNLCPNSEFCSKFFDEIQKEHRFDDPSLANTDVQKWANEPWSVAKCYINTSGYNDKPSEKEIDCAGLLCLFNNNRFFENSLNGIEVNGKTDVFKKARDTRNDILHNANYELSEGQLNDYLDLFVSVLEVKDMNGKHALESYLGIEQAKYNLDKLRNNDIDISIAGEVEKRIQEMKDCSMIKLAEEVEKARKQNLRKQQLLEEKLTEREKELQIMLELRSSQTTGNKSSQITAEFNLDLHLQVIEQTGETSTIGNDRVFESMKEYHSGKTIKANLHTSPTDGSVQRLLEHIEVLENCTIADISNLKTTVVVKINSSTCEAIETLLKLINGNEFQREIMELRKCLKTHELLKIYDVIASFSSECLENTRKSISRNAQIKDITCQKHILESTWYCSDHDEFFCPTCKDEEHGRCIGLKQVVSDRSHIKQKQILVLKREIGKFNVRINNLLVNRSDNDKSDCDIISIRMLPYGEILLVDCNNSRLKKLDRTYNIVSYCGLPEHPLDVCYTGNDRAAVCLGLNGIQFVNVSGNMKLEEQIELDHKCYSLVCHGEKLYVGDVDTIYRYNKDCQQKHVLYTNYNDDEFFSHMAVSDDGEIIYIAHLYNGLITIDKEGNHLFTLLADVAGYPINVCAVGDGTVLVAALSGGLYQVDYRGKQVLGTATSSLSGVDKLQSICFDRLTCRLLVTKTDNNKITVFKLKMQSTC